MLDDEVSPTTTDDINVPESTIQSGMNDYQLVRDRERRAPEPNPKYSFADLVYTALVVGCEIQCPEPVSYSDAMSSTASDFWKSAMDEEIDSLKKNDTWTLIPKPVNARTIDRKMDL
ncbi:hypothetical protein Dimus_039186 [Dionaea muscipula]